MYDEFKCVICVIKSYINSLSFIIFARSLVLKKYLVSITTRLMTNISTYQPILSSLFSRTISFLFSMLIRILVLERFLFSIVFISENALETELHRNMAVFAFRCQRHLGKPAFVASINGFDAYNTSLQMPIMSL